jgi:hypothetical protein
MPNRYSSGSHRAIQKTGECLANNAAFNNFAAIIMAAVWADVMWAFGFAAVFAFNWRGADQGMVRPALIALHRGCFTLWNCHFTELGLD